MVIDETIDGGVILETEPLEVVARVQRKADPSSEATSPLGAESASSALSGVFAFAKEKFARTILKQ